MWEQLLETVASNRSASWLRDLEVVSLKQDLLTLQPRPGKRDLLSFVAGRRDQLVDLVASVAGRRLDVQLVDRTATTDTPAPSTSQAPAPEGTDREQAMSLPLVREVAELFDARLIDARPDDSADEDAGDEDLDDPADQ
ncbi:MAG: hypothetical protein R3336_02330 [Phycisphaeraceae bacterium]|nr:hypothetical protein [Phycisphaeraceae bacterium]